MKMSRSKLDGDISRLPKWAQNKIENLEREVCRLKILAEETATSYEGSNVKVSRFGPAINGRYDWDWGLPKDSHIDFYLTEKPEKFRNMVSARILHPLGRKNGVIEIVAQGGKLTIEPRSGNLVWITNEDHLRAGMGDHLPLRCAMATLPL